MRGFAACVAALVVAATIAGTRAESTDAPFAKYPATVKYRGKPAAVDLKSHPDARTFRTRLRNAVAEAKGPNFAGHMIVTSWGCGTSCQMVALIDARNGRVHFAPDNATAGVDFRADSRLIVFNPAKNLREAPAVDAKTELYLWERGKLTKLR
jgi:hypothetical protein